MGPLRHFVPLRVPVNWEAAAPMPVLIQSDYRTYLLFYSREDDVVVIEWIHCAFASLMPPGDEGLEGHRYWRQGLAALGPYAAVELLSSDWPVDVLGERLASTSGHHYILEFHDSTFECVAEGYRAFRAKMSLGQALSAVVTCLDGGDLPRDIVPD